MTTLDTLARSSATAVHASVADVTTPATGIAGAAHTAAMWRTFGFAAAGAAAGVVVVLALLVAGPTIEPADNVAPTTSIVVPTTVAAAPVTPTTHPPVQAEEPAPPAVAPGTGGDAADETAPDLDPPFLSVTSPLEGEHFDTPVVAFSGTTEPGASVMASGIFCQ